MIVFEGRPLAEMFWGDAQTVTMFGFNVTCVSTLVGDSFMDIIPTSRNKWVKYEASSVPLGRSAESLKRSNNSLSDLDSVMEQDLNCMVYRKPHFSVCSISSSKPEMEEHYLRLKLDCVKQILDRILLSVEITSDISNQLTSLITKCESESNNDNATDYDYFDCNQFLQTLKKRFPESILETGPLIDFSTDIDALGADDDKVVFELKRALDLSNSKVSMLLFYFEKLTVIITNFKQLQVMEDYNRALCNEYRDINGVDGLLN